MNYIASEGFKMAAKLLASIGATSVVTNVAVYTMPRNASTLKLFTTLTGTCVMSWMVSEKAEEFVERKIDDFAKSVTIDVKKPEDEEPKEKKWYHKKEATA